MSANVELRPGLTPLVHWRSIYRGVPMVLDPFARPDVEAGAVALEEILARDKLPPPEDTSPSIADLLEKNGDRLPSALVRLFVALKLASLAQGMSGVRWKTLLGLTDFLAAGLLPAIPAGGVTDRLALCYLFAAVTGTGEVVNRGKRRPAADALKKAELPPIALNPHERCTLLSGTQLSTAAALAGLFEAERIFRSAFVAAALSATALHRSEGYLHPRVHRLYRQPGQIETAAALRALIGSAEPGRADASNEDGVEGRDAHRTPLKMGACLDLLRQSGATLERAANAVTEDRLVLWQSAEIVSGIEDSSSVACAADLVALALVMICDLSQARVAALTAAAASGTESDPDRTSPEMRAAGFVARMREHADASSDVRRLLPMAGTAALVVAIEFLEAARALKAEPERDGSPLSEVLRLMREAAPPDGEAGVGVAGDFAAIADRVGSGVFADAAGVDLPEVVPAAGGKGAAPLGGRAKRK